VTDRASVSKVGSRDSIVQGPTRSIIFASTGSADRRCKVAALIGSSMGRSQPGFSAPTYLEIIVSR
jgi:hypothetical protein